MNYVYVVEVATKYKNGEVITGYFKGIDSFITCITMTSSITEAKRYKSKSSANRDICKYFKDSKSRTCSILKLEA